jgi:hypothetical protein
MSKTPLLYYINAKYQVCVLNDDKSIDTLSPENFATKVEQNPNGSIWALTFQASKDTQDGGALPAIYNSSTQQFDFPSIENSSKGAVDIGRSPNGDNLLFPR